MEQVVGLRFIVDGEQQATASLKRFNAANEAAGSSILKVASKVSGAQAEFIRLNNLFEKNVIGVSALSSAHQKLAAEISRLTGVTVSQARDSLALASASEKAARAAREQAEATARAAQAEQRRIMAIKELEGSILRQGQSVQTAVNRLKELDALQTKGAVSASSMAQGQLEIARALAATNGYLKANGALNTQRAQAEIRAAQAAQRLAQETKAQAAAEATAAANKTRLTQSYNQLLASMNPVIAAQQKTKQTIDMLRAAVAAGAITTTQAAQALLQYRSAIRSLDGPISQVSQRLNQKGVIIQQAGYQMGDFIVQIQSGTNVMVALGQQATQLIGTFAAFATTTRSIMLLSGLGVIVPIITAIGAAMMRTSGASETLSQKLDNLRDSSDKVAETLDLIAKEDLSEKFGNMTDEVQRLSTAMLALDNAAAITNLLDALDKLEEKADAGFWDKLSPLGFGAGLAAMFSGQAALDLANEEAFRKLGFQMSRETYKGYIDGLKIAADAGDREAVVGLFDQFIEDATDAGTAASKISAEGYIVADSIRQSALAVAELVARLNGSAEESKRLSKNAEIIEEGSEAIATLWGNIKERVSESYDEYSKISAEISKATKELEREAELNREVARSGAESSAVAELRKKHVIDIATELMAEKGISGQLAENYIAAAVAAFDAADAVAQLKRNQQALDVGVNALETIWSNITKRIIEASEEYTKLREKADDSIASFEREAELNEAILKYGRESAEVAAVKKKHYMDGVEELIREVKAGDELAKKMRTAAERAYDTSQAVDGLEDKTKESAKAASILAREFERAAAAVMNINVPGAERLAALNAELNAYNRGLSESQVRIQQAAREAEVAARKAGVDSPAELAAIAAEAARIESETIKAEEGLRKYTETSRKASTATRKVAEEMTEAQKAAKEYADTMNGYVVSAVDGVADAFGDFVTRGFKDFKGFVNSVLGSFKNMIAQMIAYAARNQIMIGLGMGGVGLGTATAAAAGIGGAGTMIGGIGGVVGAGGFLSGVAGGAGAALGIGGYTSAGLFNVGANAAVASAATGAGAFASTLGAALPVIGAVAGIFSFLKKKTTVLANGISVMADETDALVQEFRTVRTSRFWGLSKKVRTSSFEAAPEVADPIRESIDAIYNDIFTMMETIGIASENYLSKILSFEVNLKDLSEQEQLEKIAEALGNFAIEAAEGVQGLSLYRKRNEELLDTLKRLSSSVFVARNAFEALGSDIFEVTLGTKNVTANFASIEATRLASFADALVESTGGIEQFSAVTTEYFENFFSDAERLAFQTKKVGEEFAKLGIEMPTSKEAFRELVDGITSDLEMAIKSNRSDFFGSKQTPFRYEEGQIDFIDETTQLLAALLNLSPAFNSLFQNTEDLTDAINGLDDSVARQAEALNERLLRLRGDIEALRDLERATMLSPENLAILEQIFDLEDEIEAAKEATRIAEERLGLEKKLLELNGDTAAIRALELAALEQSNRALQEQIWAIEDKAAADAEAARIAEAAAAEARRIADERAALERQLLDLNGDVAAIRALELAALAESNRALQEQIWAIQDKAAADEAAARAAEEAAAAARAIAEERAGLERQLLELNGDVAAIRALELAALDASNRALQEHIWAIQDKASADAEAARVAAEAAAELQRISDERATLERRYYELTGNTAKIREIELASLDETNRKYLEFIFVLEDLRDRTDAAKAAAAELAEQERRLSEERADLERRYYELTGNTAKIREMELAAIDEANKKYLEFIFYLEDLEQATEAARRVVEERNSIEEAGLELQRQLLELQGNYAAARQIELAQRQAELLLLDESNMQRQEENQALQDSIDIQQEANKLRDEERALLIELYTLQGNIDAARQIELMIREEELLLLDETNVAAQIRINALKDEINALRGVTEAIDQMNQASEVMNQRNTILRRIYGAVDDTGALREMEMADILEENRPLQEVLYRVEDDIKAQQKAIAAAEEARQKALEEQRKMEQVASERDQLITRALTLQGKTDELRQREIDAMDPLNQAMQLFIYKLEDAKKVLESINEIDFATKLDYDRAVARARAIMQAPLPELAPIPEIVIPEVPKLRLPNVRGWISEALGGNTAGVPGFAEGGYHSGGLRLVGENGPELEVTGPSRIYSNSDTKAMLGGDSELRREVEDLKVLTIQNAKYIKRTYDIYRKWDVDGLPTERDA